MKEDTVQLNPFAYISETDIRFYLLIVISIIVPSSWALSYSGVVYSAVGGTDITLFQQLIGMFAVMFIVAFFIYWRYRSLPEKIIKKSKFRKFESGKFPEQHESIEELYQKHIPDAKRPELLYQPFDNSETAFTFGRKNHNYIGISGRIITKFRSDKKGFKTIILHELSHVVNGDVEKAYLAASAWRVLIFTLLIAFGIHVLFQTSLAASILIFGIIAGTDIRDLIESITPGRATIFLTAGFLYFVPFMIIVYILRNQIIRLREFYADARVLEWQESTKDLQNTLEGISNEQLSRFEILTKFHPNIAERIYALKNNLVLFKPSLWVAFSAGFLISVISYYLLSFKRTLFYVSPAAGGWHEILYQVFISIAIILIAIAISSSYHKSILKNIFIDNKRFFSFTIVINLILFSLMFSLGYITDALTQMVIYAIGGIEGAIELLIDYIMLVIPKTIYFTAMLLYLLVFASMSIRRSYSRKDALKNFLIISGLFALFNIGYSHLVASSWSNWHFFMMLLAGFSIVTFMFIRIRDTKLTCPHCRNKISGLPRLTTHCPECRQNLFSWAVYSFS